MNISNLLSWILNSIQSSHSEHIFLQTLLYPITSLVQVFFQFSSLTIAYHNIGFNSYSLTVLVKKFDSCRPPSHHTVLCSLHSSSFITKWILLSMCLVRLVYLQFLAMHIADLLSNITRGDCYVTTYVSLFRKSLFGILKCYRSIPELHATLYSLLSLDWATGPGTFV